MIYDIDDGVLRIPEGEEYILEESYAHRDDIRCVYFPGTMKVIGPVAFMECVNLTDIYLNEGLLEIGDGAFLGCTLLGAVKFPKTLKTICPMAFWECGLYEVSIPPTVELIGESAFWNDVNLVSADVMGENTIIEQDAFGNCPALIKGYIAPGFPDYEDAPSKLLYSILWASNDLPCHSETEKKAVEFIKNNQGLVMERILRSDNAPALSGILKRSLFDMETLEFGLAGALEKDLTEISAMILKAKSNEKKGTDEFEL